ncbi:efflux transporter outer membrane subunit [Pandoraea terrigena]|uniref:Multidrug transporter n=1 Tax=Pandoraea terrigena TaxID=2508292 RepID=A0A5E4XNW2_9BURK|nr:efflux transporter outer membrane subunit [Pandoraea terrigena]VVE38067.1 multidrug transporter [Pandoraea terrigena]
MHSNRLTARRVVRTSLLGAAAAATLTLAGCMSLAPNYTQPAPSVPDTFPHATSAAAAAASGATAPLAEQKSIAKADAALVAADTPWQDYFADANVRKLIGIALENNRDLRVSILNIEKARATYRVREAAELPTIDAGGAGSVYRTPGAVTGGSPTITREYTATLGTTSYELDLWGRVKNLSDAALASYLNTVEAKRAAQITLVANVATAYLTWASDRALEALANSTLESQQASYDITKGSFDLGNASALDLKEAEQTVASARGDVARYAAQVGQDENALALLLGAPVPAELAPPAVVSSVTAARELAAGVPSTVLLRRPDVLEAEQTLRGANADIGAARAAMFPTVTLTAAGGTASSGLSGLFKAGTGYWSFAPNISLPIFDGGSLRASLDAAKVTQKIDIAQYQHTVQSAFKEVADALATRATMQARRDAQKTLVDAAQAAYDLSLARYRAGVDAYTTVLTNQRTLYTAQQDDITLQLAWQSNLVTLYQVLGGGA